MKKHMLRLMMMLVLGGILLAQAGCAFAQTAFVNNGSDPQSRLNMRTAPGRDAASKGSFYSGTQVEIVADAGGGWSQVVIGNEISHISGYMMTEYLCESADGVLDACPARVVDSPYGTPSVVLRDRPGNSYDVIAMLPVGEPVRVIGIAGDFCYVITQADAVGCLAGDELK